MIKFQPDGWHTVTPRIVVSDPKNPVDFINAVFLAQGECRARLPAEVRIGDSVVMVSGGDGLRDPRRHFCTSMSRMSMRPTGVPSRPGPCRSKHRPRPYGDRRAMVKDAWGNIWQLATHRRDPPADEIRARLADGGG